LTSTPTDYKPWANAETAARAREGHTRAAAIRAVADPAKLDRSLRVVREALRLNVVTLDDIIGGDRRGH
jgi:hypothetical protein